MFNKSNKNNDKAINREYPIIDARELQLVNRQDKPINARQGKVKPSKQLLDALRQAINEVNKAK
jgi:hypothetical protein